jgi:hypothetical protein
MELWPGKGSYWELTTLLKADWYVIPQQRYTDYTYDSVLRLEGKASIVRKYTKNVVDVSEIPFAEYDLVITNDPLFPFPSTNGTLFAYYVNEHWDWRYQRSIRRPLLNADLFLAHMLDAPFELTRLPQAVAFPYLQDPTTMRSLFASQERRDSVWVDWRTLSILAGETRDHSGGFAEAAAKRLQAALGITVAFRKCASALYYGEDPPRWGDATEYYRQLGQQKYYLAVGRGSGAGQALADAAALGCLCVGERDKAYHRLLCHPAVLCGDLQELPNRLRRLRASSDLQSEVRAWQEDALRKYFVERPVQLLKEALERKRAEAGEVFGRELNETRSSVENEMRPVAQGTGRK